MIDLLRQEMCFTTRLKSKKKHHEMGKERRADKKRKYCTVLVLRMAHRILK